MTTTDGTSFSNDMQVWCSLGHEESVGRTLGCLCGKADSTESAKGPEHFHVQREYRWVPAITHRPANLQWCRPITADRRSPLPSNLFPFARWVLRCARDTRASTAPILPIGERPGQKNESPLLQSPPDLLRTPDRATKTVMIDWKSNSKGRWRFRERWWEEGWDRAAGVIRATCGLQEVEGS